MAKETKVFMDPVHGLITFDRRRGEDILLDLINSPEFQRLRRITQLGISWVTFPSAVHTRFSHSLGACHLAGRYMDKLYDTHKKSFYGSEDEFERARLLVRVAALLHDIGHGPFSHVFENAMNAVKKDFKHEKWSIKIIKDETTVVNQILRSDDSEISPDDVSLIIDKTFSDRKIVNIISGQSDIDRMDYIQRDSLFTGVRYGHIDQDWIIHSLRLEKHESGEQVIAIDGAKGINSIVSFILARLNLFQKVYFHHKTRSAEIQLSKIIQKMAELIIEKGMDLNYYDFNKFVLAKTGEIKIKDFLALDDFGFISNINFAIRNKFDRDLSDLCECFINHKIFKSVEIPKEKIMEDLESAIDNVCVKESNGYKHDSRDFEYYRGKDEAKTTYYESDLYEDNGTASPEPESDEIGNEIFIKLEGRKLQKLSLNSDIINAITKPYDEKVQKVRLCFDNRLYDYNKVEKLVKGG